MDLKDLKVPAIPVSVSAAYGVIEGIRAGNPDLVAAALGTIGIGVLIGGALYVYMHSSNQRHNKFYKENRYQNKSYKKKSFWRRW